MKKRFSGTDLQMVIMYAVSVVLAVIICVKMPDMVALAVVAVCVVSGAVAMNVTHVRKIIRGVFYGTGKDGAKQQLSFEKLALPLAVIHDGSIVWYNSSFREKILGDSDRYLYPLEKILPELDLKKATEPGGAAIKFADKEYTVFASAQEENDDLSVCYFVDDTRLKTRAREYSLSRPVVMEMVVDTYDEALKDLKESQRAQIMADIDQLAEDTANAAAGTAIKVGSSRYHIIIEDRYFDKILQNNFVILKKAKRIKEDVTLSIGVGRGGKSLSECDALAKRALDMALGRGGDQAVIKTVDGYEFFGGNAPGMEKRSKVRSRIVANAFRNVIMQSETVLIMGHKLSDFDAIGSAVGVYEAVESLGKRRFIVVREEATLAGELIEHIKCGDYPGDVFISPERAERYAGPSALLVVVDTHSAKMTESEELCRLCQRKVVIDHHRRMADYISDTVVSYHEPYASSASELVCELLQYILPVHYRIRQRRAAALMAGIMLDTRNFSEKAGVRTFEAAAYLRRQGANSTEVLKLFAVTKDVYTAKSQIVTSASIYKNIAVAFSDNLPKELAVAIPQAANDLLTIDGVWASIVAVKVEDQINVSARSLGDINVQLLMESLGGGGHLTMAGAQLKGCTVEQAREKIIAAIDNYKK